MNFEVISSYFSLQNLGVPLLDLVRLTHMIELGIKLKEINLMIQKILLLSVLESTELQGLSPPEVDLQIIK